MSSETSRLESFERLIQDCGDHQLEQALLLSVEVGRYGRVLTIDELGLEIMGTTEQKAIEDVPRKLADLRENLVAIINSSTRKIKFIDEYLPERLRTLAEYHRLVDSLCMDALKKEHYDLGYKAPEQVDPLYRRVVEKRYKLLFGEDQ